LNLSGHLGVELAARRGGGVEEDSRHGHGVRVTGRIIGWRD
jgi:hypothetical protein